MPTKKTSFIRVKYPNGYDTIEQAYQLDQIENLDLLKKYIKSSAKQDTLFLGGSVFYNEKSRTTINVLTGTIDLNYLTYYSVIDKASIDEDVADENIKISKLKEMCVEFFRFYIEKNGFIPKFIVYYRNGLHLKDEKLIMHKQEVQMLKKAYSEINGEVIKPSITLIVVSHDTETIFYNLKENEMKNLPSGLATEPLFSIDCEKTYTREFYLSTYEDISCRPYRYRIVIDENNYKQENIINLTFRLCYVFLKNVTKFEAPCAIYYSNFLAENLSIGDLETLNKELNDGSLQRLELIEFDHKILYKNINKSSAKKIDYSVYNMESDLAEIYNIKDPFEEENDSVSSFFDTVIFLLGFLIFHSVIIWIVVSE